MLLYFLITIQLLFNNQVTDSYHELEIGMEQKNDRKLKQKIKKKKKEILTK